MTPEEYVKAGGNRCPYCRAEQITGGPVNVDVRSASQEVTCLFCGAYWNDLYELVGYTDLVKDE